VVVLAVTNRLDIVDPALLRAGRFDFLLELPVPDESAREEIFKVHAKGKPLASDVDLKLLAQNTEGLVGADIESICRKASMLAIREFLDNQEDNNDKDYTKFKIAAKHFNQASKMVKESKRANRES
jgi:transitional endoplasmic reticulum ATPase